MRYSFRFKWFNRFTLVAVLASLIASAVQVTPVYAAGIVVNSAADTVANDGVCTLREALEAAQANFAQNGCAGGSVVGADTISFAGNYTITLSSQLPTLTSSVIVQGKGAANTIIQAAATPNSATWRVFQVHTTGKLTLDGVTVRNGRCNGSCTVLGGVFPDSGGGIYNKGTLTVTNSIISNNTADHGGGIINYNGTLTVTNSTISGNTTGAGGGGIYTDGTLSPTENNLATLTVTNSTISGNTAFGGGGIMMFNDSIVTITNTTISGNNAVVGGGIDIAGGTNDSFTLTNSTIAGNMASDSGGGISNGGVRIRLLQNTVVASNSGGNCSGNPITDGGHNLDSSSSCGFGPTNGSMSNTDPILGSLASNGGLTQTMRLLDGSPAIDHGDDLLCNVSPVNGVDQRGVARPQGVSCDIGAYEYNGTFWDVPLNYWAWTFIERLYNAGITSGCVPSPLKYCPETQVTRAQMAVFLLRGIHGSSYIPPAVGSSTGFADVAPGDFAAAWIKQLAIEGITGGCGFGNYCPGAFVTRAQMSVFLLRAKHGSGYAPPAVGGSTGFADVAPGDFAAAWIKQLVAEGITSGCGSGTYCPESPVTRAQMAVFLVRTFNLL